MLIKRSPQLPEMFEIVLRPLWLWRDGTKNDETFIKCFRLSDIYYVSWHLSNLSYGASSWEYFTFQHLSSIFFTLGPMKSHSHSQVCRLVGSVLRAPEVQKEEGCYLAHSVQYHTVYVRRCQNHCGASQNIQQAQGRQNPQGAWQYDPEGAILMMKILT